MSAAPQRKLGTKADYARHRKCSKPYISKLIKQGLVVLAEGLVDFEATDDNLRAIADPLKGAIKKSQYPGFDPLLDSDEDERNDDGPREEKENLSEQLLRARIVTEQEKGRIAKLQRQKRQGQLVEAADVDAAEQIRASQEREAMMNFPTIYGPDIAAELNVESRLLSDVLRKYVRKHLEDRSRASVRGRSVDDESD